MHDARRYNTLTMMWKYRSIKRGSDFSSDTLQSLKVGRPLAKFTCYDSRRVWEDANSQQPKKINSLSMCGIPTTPYQNSSHTYTHLLNTYIQPRQRAQMTYIPNPSIFPHQESAYPVIRGRQMCFTLDKRALLSQKSPLSFNLLLFYHIHAHLLES